MEYVTQTGVVELEGRWCVAGEAACFDKAGKRREKEHSERRRAESGGGRRQAMPKDGTILKTLHLRALLGWLEQSVRPGLGSSPACRVSAPT